MSEMEEEIDTLHPQIYQHVVKEIPRAVESYITLVRERKKVLDDLYKSIKPVSVAELDRKGISKYKIAGVDGGGNGKALEGFYFGIVGALAYTSSGLDEEDKTPISSGTSLLWDDEFDPGRRAAVIRDRIMYEIAKIAIEKRKPDILLLDGPLIPNSRYIPSLDDSDGYKEDYEKMMNALFSLLDTIIKEYEERNMLFACIVKRVRSILYSKILGLQKPMRDSVLLAPILRKGQRTELIKPAEGRMLKDEFPSEHKDVKLFFLRTSKHSPIRVEIPACLKEKVDEISSVIYSTSDPLSGIPFHILRADALTKVSVPTTDLTYNRFISHIMDEVKSGRLSNDDLDMADLRRLEIWRL